MRMVVVAPGEKPRIEDYVATLENLQSFVGGYIEVVRYKHHDVYVNEDGISKGLFIHRRIPGGPYIRGTFVILNHDDEGNPKGLTDYEAQALVEIFAEELT